ncbi:MAG: hypothetical protein FJX77_02705 [Armatimonadetes bacterium]|nr:hypothetical protein [Armatimonadota bacterium]
MAPTWLAILYVGGLFSCLIRLRCGTEQIISQLHWHAAQPWMRFIGEGACLLLFLILVMTATDTGALLVGRRWGRRKLAPVVSPGKTWEGAVGGMTLGVVAGLAGAAWFGMPGSFAAAAALLASLFGQLGDLCESALKRELDVKDFGSLLPGHGGLLDRFDNLLFTGAVTYLLVLLWP